jgi:hypothetical protein
LSALVKALRERFVHEIKLGRRYGGDTLAPSATAHAIHRHRQAMIRKRN